MRQQNCEFIISEEKEKQKTKKIRHKATQYEKNGGTEGIQKKHKWQKIIIIIIINGGRAGQAYPRKNKRNDTVNKDMHRRQRARYK